MKSPQILLTWRVLKTKITEVSTYMVLIGLNKENAAPFYRREVTTWRKRVSDIFPLIHPSDNRVHEKEC